MFLSLTLSLAQLKAPELYDRPRGCKDRPAQAEGRKTFDHLSLNSNMHVVAMHGHMASEFQVGHCYYPRACSLQLLAAAE